MKPWAPCGFASGATTTPRHASRRRYRPTRASASFTRCRLRRSPWPAASKTRERSRGGFWSWSRPSAPSASWDSLVLFMDWLLADPRRARRGWWILYPLLGAVIIATPWIEERFHPPFGRYWPWNGTTGGPSGAGEKLIYGVGYLLFLVTMILL